MMQCEPRTWLLCIIDHYSSFIIVLSALLGLQNCLHPLSHDIALTCGDVELVGSCHGCTVGDFIGTVLIICDLGVDCARPPECHSEIISAIQSLIPLLIPRLRTRAGDFQLSGFQVQARVQD